MAATTLTVDDLSTLKVAELKKELKDRGLAVSGNKTELLERLQTYIEENQPLEAEELSMGDNSLALNDTATDDSLLQDEKDISVHDSLLEDKPVEKPVRQKITMSDGPDKENGHDTVKTALTAEEKLKQRGERFGVQSEDAKKKARAERFGVSSTTSTTSSLNSKKSNKIVNTPVTTLEVDKLKHRSERFGQVISPSLSKAEDLEKLKKRAERFGTVISTSLSKVVEVDKLKQRSERFGEVVAPTLSKVEEQEKILKRKERFGALAGGTTPLSSDDVEAKKKKRAERFGMS